VEKDEQAPNNPQDLNMMPIEPKFSDIFLTFSAFINLQVQPPT
jgi:hypothetical protein